MGSAGVGTIVIGAGWGASALPSIGLMERKVYVGPPRAMLRSTTHGHTLVELLVVLAVLAIGLATAVTVFDGLLGREAARNAARQFQRDLTLARYYASRTRTPTVIRFDEGRLLYRVESAGGTLFIARDLGGGADIRVGAMDLDQDGDTLAFDRTGTAVLTVAHRGLGRAAFMAASDTVEVHFNALGASRLDEGR